MKFNLEELVTFARRVRDEKNCALGGVLLELSRNSSADKISFDEIQFGPELSPGVHVALRRTPDGEVRQITCSPTRDGVPLRPNSEVANVSAESEDGWHKLTSLYRTGPAQVATPAYRSGYDRIFGKKQKVGLA